MIREPVLLRRRRAELGEPGVFRLVEPPEGALALAAAEWAEEAGLAGCLYVARSESRAHRLASAARGFAPDLQVIVLPAWDCLPYDRFSPSPSIMARRMAALADIAQQAPSAGRLILTTVESLLQRLPPASLSTDAGFRVEVGMPLSLDELKIHLLRAGYVLDERVDEPGEAALRNTIDVFPGTDEQPFRLRLEEGIIAAIDRYDPVTQRTDFSIAEAITSPVSEIILDESDVRRFLQGEEGVAEETAATMELWTRHLLSGPKEAPRRTAALEHWLPLFHERLHTVFELLPEARVILDPEVEERRDAWYEQIADAYEHRSAMARASRPAHPGQLQPLPPDRLYLHAEQWADCLRRRPILALHRSGRDEIDLGAAPVPRFADAGDPSRTLVQYIKAQCQAGDRVILAAADDAERRRLATIVERRLGAGPEGLARWEDAATLKPGAIAMAALDLAEGFAVPGWTVIAARDVLPGAARLVASLGKAKAEVFASDVLRVGDLVVHAEHGIGQVRGLEVLERNGAAHECLSLAYAGDQKLLVPAEEIGQLWRYGSADAGIALDRLSGDVWAWRRLQVDAEVEETARALVQLADERARAAGPRLTAPASRYRRFVARFPYAETPDQQRAIEAVLRDHAGGRPMNRLVCGDVGFGKTEVALRAAGVAVFSGKQVALVAPTTVLVRQHLETFRRRFADFGVRVEALSRHSRTAADRAIIEGVGDGSIAILVGTHALASEKLRFHDLGLVVIDEEQRFGEKQKQHLRELQAGMHVLAMSATPIPRTLQSALAGVVDLSVIATPPVRRRPVRTFVLPFDPVIARDALLREQMQGGQSFIVCPRIADLQPMRQRLAELAPELDIAVAHGRMKADALDETMVAFADGAHDVLLTTNIIESGLDIPSANTMLVWCPDRFGLSDLHQLRGRVGRGRRRGVVYLCTDPQKPLPPATEKRVRTLQALEGLGAGFAIGARDLDMRGAGDLFGAEQSGHVRLIGAELYQHLLQRAVRRVRGEQGDVETAPEVRSGLAPVIPRDYVPEEEVRIDLYRRLARLNSETDASDLADEIADRFGPLPDPVRDAINFSIIRAQCALANVIKVEAGPSGIAFTFRDEEARTLAREKVPEALGATKWAGERLILQITTETPHERMETIGRLLGALRAA